MIQTMLAALSEDSTLESDPLLLAGAGRREGGDTHTNLYKNLNKQKINTHFYKLQHDGTVECINYMGGKESTVFTKSNSKKV